MEEFEELYLQVREKEGRIYTDAEVASLPFIGSEHPHYEEWLIREASNTQLLEYLRKKNKPLKILDLGCGNGWMTNRLSSLTGVTVLGIDINGFEIEQAKRVFNKTPNVSFDTEQIFQRDALNQFDVIVMAASIQYFQDIKKLLTSMLDLLKRDGEIHILDSHFYTEETVARAKEATLNYYKQLGFKKMTEYYHHHLWSELEPFNYTVQNRTFTDKLFLKLFRARKNYFPWIIIAKPD